MLRVPLEGLKDAVEDGEVLRLDGGRAFDGAGGVDVADDGVDFRLGVAELDERRWHGVVDDLDHAAADELLVLDQRKIRLDAGGVAVHHEADGAGGGENGDLGVAVAMLFAVGERAVPCVAAGFDELIKLRDNEGLGGVLRLANIVDLGAMHADDVEEGLAVDVEAGAGSAGDVRLLRERRCGAERRASLGNAGGLPIRIPTKDRGECSREVAAGIGVVRQDRTPSAAHPDLRSRGRAGDSRASSSRSSRWGSRRRRR